MRSSRNDLGAVAVETVFVLLLVLIPLLIGTLDLGRALYTSIVVEEVAQEGANFMAFEGVNQAAVRAQLTSDTTTLPLDSNDITAVCTPVTRTVGAASRTSVTVVYTIESFFLRDFDLRQTAQAEGSAACA